MYLFLLFTTTICLCAEALVPAMNFSIPFLSPVFITCRVIMFSIHLYTMAAVSNVLPDASGKCILFCFENNAVCTCPDNSAMVKLPDA